MSFELNLRKISSPENHIPVITRGSHEPASSVPLTIQHLTFDHPAEQNVERRETSGLHSFIPTLSLFSVSEAHSKDVHK